MSGNFKRVVLSEDDFWEKYEPLCKPSLESAPDAKNIINELNHIHFELNENLSKYWPEDDGHYEVSCDANIVRHHSMGLYSESIYCNNFLEVIYSVLSKYEDWCFHVTCECESLPDGQFFYYDGNFYFDVSMKLDYNLFSVTKNIEVRDDYESMEYADFFQ